MLGDSLRRRRKPLAQAAEPFDPEGRNKRSGSGHDGPLGLTWRRWGVLGAVVLVGSFVVGYLISTQLLFPVPETAGTGIPVPSLYGESRSAAESILRDAGLVVGEVTELTSAEVAPGQVLAQAPVPGQQLRRGAEVSFAVSAGSPVVRVPPVRGMGGQTARELLEALGFQVEVRSVTDASVPAGAAVRTRPEAGTPRDGASVVTLEVAVAGNGSAEDPARPVGMNGGE